MRARLSLRDSRYLSETARRGYLIRLQRESQFAHPFAECDTVDNSLTLCPSLYILSKQGNVTAVWISRS